MLREVKPVADNEIVRNFKAAIINFDIDLAAAGLIEQSANFYAVSLLVKEIVNQIVHGRAGVDNIFDEQNIATFGVVVEVLEDIDFAACVGVGVVA